MRKEGRPFWNNEETRRGGTDVAEMAFYGFILFALSHFGLKMSA
jgi:hypothetical protein